MLCEAIPAGCFDVVMVGFNFLNPGARDRVFPLCIEHGVGTQIMHAVRNALSDPGVLAGTIEELLERKEIDAALVDPDAPLNFLEQHPDVGSVIEAAYRFCRHEPGVSVVLTGTGSVEHLDANVGAIMGAELPQDLREKLELLFGAVRSVSGD